MSLDIYLYDNKTLTCDCGKVHDLDSENESLVFNCNITHNLNKMANAESEVFYKTIWRPEEIGVKLAGQMIPVLKFGIGHLKSKPNYFKQFDSPNGWGNYDCFVPWLERLLSACEQYPNATIEISR